MARSIDTIAVKHRSVTPAVEPLGAATASPPRSRSLSGLLLAALVVGGFFVLTRPRVGADTVATLPNQPASAPSSIQSQSTDSRLGPPQPSSSASLEETVILDAPLPTSREQSNSAAAAPVAAESTPTTSYTVRILNGTTTRGAAASYEQRLKVKGVSVSSIGTAVNRYATSAIYFGSGHRAHAEEIQATLGWSGTQLQEDRLAKPADVLVVIGADHAQE